MNKFRSAELAKALYRRIKLLPVKGEVKDQLHRASLSVCLNLAEGSAKATVKERTRFYQISLASLREVQMILDLEELPYRREADILGAHLFKLIEANRRPATRNPTPDVRYPQPGAPHDKY